MSNFIARLFQPRSAHDDGLRQSQREAIIDLLNFCSYADDRLSLVEDGLVTAELAKCHWDPAVPLELFVSRSVTRVRNALESPERRAGFLTELAQRLDTPDVRTRALSLSRKLFGADGDFSTDEKSIFQEVEKAFRGAR